MIFPAYPHLPLVTAYLIAFTGPLMITLLSARFLKEKMGFPQVAAVLVGFGAVTYSMVAQQTNGIAAAFDPAQMPYILRMIAGTFRFHDDERSYGTLGYRKHMVVPVFLLSACLRSPACFFTTASCYRRRPANGRC